MRIGLAFLILSFALPAVSQTKHPFTFEDMMKLKRVEEPVVSPDGKWVLFAAVDVDLQANTKTPHVWVVPLNSQVSQNQGDLGHPTSQKSQSGVPHVSPVLRDVGYFSDSKTGSHSTPSVPSVAQGRLSAQQDHSPANDPASVRMTDSREREIISDQDAGRPRWAPDGKRFAFVSTKENGSQIWIAEFDGATVTVTAKHRLTNIATEADGELWSPDGKYILFKSDVYPECDGGPNALVFNCNFQRVKAAETSKVKALVFDRLLYRHWNAYKEGKRTHIFVILVDPCAGVATGDCHLVAIPRDLTPGDYDAPVFSLGGQDDYAFSPDGKEICYASNHDAMPAASTNNDLFTVPVNVSADATSAQVIAATKNITAGNKAADNTPLYSPDGKYIAYRAQARPGYESDRFRLMLYDRKTGRKRSLTPDWFDKWVDSFAWAPQWAPGAWEIYTPVEEEGSTMIYRVWFNVREPINVSRGQNGGAISGALELSTVSRITRGYDDDLAITADGQTLLFTRMSLQRPSEIQELASHPGKFDFNNLPKGDQLTHLNDSVLSQVSMSPLEPFWFTGANNDKVQGFLVKPPNFDPSKKYPVKFLIHGGPEGAWGDDWSYRWNPELFAANGYVVIMINFHGSTGYGQKFIDAINGDWGGAPFEDLMKGLDYAEEHYGFIDKDRECALGASYGGYMANWILGHTNRFKCIVTHDGMFNAESAWGDTEELWFNEWEFKGTPYTNREMYRKWSPHLFATNFKTPTLVIHGQRDYRLDVSQGFDLFTTLQRLGVPSKMLYFPDEGHWVLKPQNSQLWYKTVNDWVDQWTKPVGSGQ